MAFTQVLAALSILPLSSFSLPAHVFHIDIVLSRANYEIDLNRAAVGLRISDCFFADNDKTIENEDEIKSDAIIYAQNEINSQL